MIIKKFENFDIDPYNEENDDFDEDSIVIRRESENYSRREVIDLIYNSSNFTREDLNEMSNDELEELWDDMEMDDILSDD